MRRRDPNFFYNHRCCLWNLKSRRNPSRASNSPDSSHSFHSAGGSSFSPPLRLHGVIFMHHQDAGGWWMPTIHTRPSGSCTRAPLLLEITITCCSTRFHSALTRSTSLGSVFNARAEKEVYCRVLHHIIYFQGPVILFQCSVFASFYCRNTLSEGRVKTCQVYGRVWAPRQTIIFCMAICELPLQMIDMLNRMSGPRINTQAHSWVTQPPLLLWTGME